MSSPSGPATPSEQLCALLDRLEMTIADLARETKLNQKTIKDAMVVDGQPSLRTRCAIEAALAEPIWSTPEDFKQRREAAAQIGFAPDVASLKQLKRRAGQLGIKGYGFATNKADLTAMILKELAARKARQVELQAWMQEELKTGK